VIREESDEIDVRPSSKRYSLSCTRDELTLVARLDVGYGDTIKSIRDWWTTCTHEKISSSKLDANADRSEG